MEQFPLATIIHGSPAGMTADHIPLFFEATPGSAGKLIGHVAKSNPLWQLQPDQELLVVFQGPSTYISPNWYATKPEAGKVVPTWNYSVVHAYGSIKAVHEPDQVLRIITHLTDRHEAAQAHPWRVSDAPSDFTERLMGQIVGIEITIHRMQGKWKVSQNQPQQNQQSLAEGLRSAGSEAQAQMALLVQSHGAK